MIMNVAAFIEWLKTQDQAAEVRVMRAERMRNSYEGGMDVTDVPFDPDPIRGTVTYTDYTEDWAKHLGRTDSTLFLGESS
jgi:hypothetical protein